MACRRCAASGASGHLATLSRRNGLLFSSSRGALGLKEQIRRLSKGLHSLPSKKGLRRSPEAGLGEEAEEELLEAAGGDKPEAGRKAEERKCRYGQKLKFRTLDVAVKVDGVEAGERLALGDKAAAEAASRAREAGEEKEAAKAMRKRLGLEEGSRKKKRRGG